jgi:SAM-dependent methyltransferase
MSDTIVFNTETQAFGIRPGIFKCSGYGLGELIVNMPNVKGLEIGCDIGDTTEFLLKCNPNLNLTSVDPYLNYQDWNGRMLDDRQHALDRMSQRMSVFGDRFRFIRSTSDDAVSSFDDGEFDFIFVDGLHTYEQLTLDCANYYSKLKPGGIFAGHDFTAIEGVNRAAKEFAEKQNKTILTTECDVWYWIK